MKITCVTNEVHPDTSADSLPKIFGRASEAGITSFELRLVEGKRFPLFEGDAFARLKEHSDAFNINYTAVSPGLFKVPLKSEMTALHTDHLLPMSLDLADQMGIKTLIVFAPTRAASPFRDEFEQVVSLIKNAVDVAVARGFTVQLENLPGSWADTSDACFNLLEAVNHPDFGYVWDTGNLYEAEETHFRAGYEKLKPYIRNVHLKDGAVVDGKMVWMRYGTGVTDVKGQVDALIADDYQGTLVLEAACQPHEMDDFPTSIAYLKTLLA